MQKFLLKILFVLVPSLLFLAVLEWNTRRIDNSALAVRSAYFFQHYRQLEGLCFGSSLVAQSVNPAWLDYPTASLALSGSSLNVDYLLFKRANTLVTPRFVLFDLTVHLLNQYHSDAWIKMRKLPYYYGIKPEKRELKDYFLSGTPLYRSLRLSASNEKINEYGFSEDRSKQFKKLEYDHEQIVQDKRIQKFLGNAEPFNAAINQINEDLLKEIITICRAQGTKVILYSPPKYYIGNDAAETLPDFARRATFLREVVDDENVFFWNLERMGERDPRNFANINHVSLQGAKMATEELNRRLKQLFD